MAETKDDIAAERDALKRENDNLRAQLAARGQAPATGTPQHTFMLSEGDRQELVQRGVVNINGRLMTRDDVRAEMGDRGKNVDLGTAEPDPQLLKSAERTSIRGFDYVYPSVEPGKIDPEVAGTPGINGPAADTDGADK